MQNDKFVEFDERLRAKKRSPWTVQIFDPGYVTVFYYAIFYLRNTQIL